MISVIKGGGAGEATPRSRPASSSQKSRKLYAKDDIPTCWTCRASKCHSCLDNINVSQPSIDTTRHSTIFAPGCWQFIPTYGQAHRMAGVEAIGLALGILPLLISAIEHYDHVLRPFSRYRSFTSKAQRFIDELETERTIFRTECQLLLAVVTGPKTAEEMLQNHRHSSWDDHDVRDRLNGQLGVLGTACTSLISKIESKLAEIGKKSEQFGILIAQTKPVRIPRPSTRWLSTVSLVATFQMRYCLGIIFGVHV